MLKGTKIACKYGMDGTAKILRKQGANGYMVEFKTIVPYQDFKTLKITEEIHTRKAYMKTIDIKIID